MDAQVSTVRCPQCGHSNRPGVDELCPRCSYPVYWDAQGDMLPGADAEWLPVEGPRAGARGEGHDAVDASGSERDESVVAMPVDAVVPSDGPSSPDDAEAFHRAELQAEARAASTAARGGQILRIRIEPDEVTLSPDGPEAVVDVHVSNAGAAVEEFVVDLPDVPAWLQVEPAEVRLLPGTAEDVALRLRPLAAGPVAAGELALSVRVRSALRPDAVQLAPLTLVVPVQEGQLAMTAEPQMLRGGSGRLRLHVTSTGNQAVTVDLRAADAEGRVRFTLRPSSVSLAPYGSAEAHVDVSVRRPFRGDTVTRPLTLHASAGSREAVATATLVSSPLITEGTLTALRVLLTLLGGGLMVAGARSTWTNAPAIGRGLEWTYEAYAAIALDVELLSMAELGVAVPDALVSAGAVVVALALLAVLGLVGAKGRLTRFASLLAALFVLAFLAVLFVTTGVDPAGGTTAVLLGSAVAFAGGLLARR